MRIIFISVALVLALTACKDGDGRNVETLSYGVDQETGLCFANGVESISHVECTPKVLEIADEDYTRINYYYVDPQTELCFVHAFKADANVPCIPAVKKKISE